MEHKETTESTFVHCRFMWSYLQQERKNKNNIINSIIGINNCKIMINNPDDTLDSNHSSNNCINN